MTAPRLVHGSTFTGIGGFDLACEQEEITTAWQIENDPFCLKVLAARFPSTSRHVTDVREAGSHNLCPVNLLTGGSPCQDFSTNVNGRRAGLAGNRSGLYFEYQRILHDLKPTWAIFENVPGLLSAHDGRDFAIVLGGFAGFIPEVPKNGWRNSGFIQGWEYNAAWRVLDLSCYGVPQKRRRVFIVASLRDGGSAQVLLNECRAVETATTRETPPQTVVPVAINTLNTSSNGVGISYHSHTLDTFGGQVVLAPFDPDGVREIAGIPPKLDKLRGKALGNAVPVPVVRSIVADIKRAEAVYL